MNKRYYVLILVILVAGLLLSACNRSASVSPLATPTTNGEIPFPVATQSQIMKDILAATQTAAALKGTITTGNLPGLGTPTAAGEIDLTPTEVLATATPTAVVYPTPTAGRPSQYTIQVGEFPFCIARRFNVDAGTLLSMNRLTVYSLVTPGTVLTIPQSGSWSNGARSLKAHPTTYTVMQGDSIGLIACGFGDADPNTILAANGLKAGAILTPGQVLSIP
jgi:LysM repeat protein